MPSEEEYRRDGVLSFPLDAQLCREVGKQTSCLCQVQEAETKFEFPQTCTSKMLSIFCLVDWFMPLQDWIFMWACNCATGGVIRTQKFNHF